MKTENAPSEDYVQNEPPQWVYLLVVLVATWGIVSLTTGDWNTYRILDNAGYVQHESDTPVWIKGTWLDDEYRICQIPLVPGQDLPETSHLLCGQDGIVMAQDLWSPGFIRGLSDYEFAELMGGKWMGLEPHFHVLPVRYWGRIDRTDRHMFSWRCQKESSGLVCRALN